ncbi:MAG: hypothetical protein K2N84_05920 [Clostridia bacterium]|nr:hypothetical protein [Clostridia bacterium]
MTEKQLEKKRAEHKITEKEIAGMDASELRKELRGLDNFVGSIWTAMRMNQKEAAELAKAVKAAFLETGGIDGVTVINAEAALRACKLAENFLA